MNTLSKNEMQELARAKATELGFDPLVFLAIITVESSWIPKAIRYEPHYSYLVTPEVFAKLNGIDVKTETLTQQISWGLGQVMGGNVRWLGYTGPMINMSEPVLAIDIAGKYFKKRCAKYAALEDQIVSYNCGSAGKVNGEYSEAGKKYLAKVLPVLKALRKETPLDGKPQG